jgi:hypothetical protein
MESVSSVTDTDSSTPVTPAGKIGDASSAAPQAKKYTA